MYSFKFFKCKCVYIYYTTIHFLWTLCFSNSHRILFKKLNTVFHNFADLSDSSKVNLVLYGSTNLTSNQNSSLVINACIDYILKSEFLKGDLF